MSISRRRFVQAGLLASGGLTALFSDSDSRADAPANRPMNVLFIAVDDMRPQLNCFGHERMISPNLDRLAARGTAFQRTYCQQAVCAPSRASLLTGMRPDSTRVWDLNTPLPTTRPDVVTLPGHFLANGYEAVSMGKIYHHGKRDDPNSWSLEPWYPKTSSHADPKTREEGRLAREEARKAGKESEWRGPATECLDVPDETYPDGLTAAHAIEEMRRLKDRPFFLAAGFLRPHLPFACPKRYWDMYPEDTISLANNPFRPEDCPDIALHTWGELRAYYEIPKAGPLSDDKARELIRGYYACTTFTDTQIGKLLDEVDNLGLRDNTVVVVWGDHGWNLGEHGLWCKHCNFETSVHSPLIISSPNQAAPGRPTTALCEFVDIYPTLCDICGLSLPPHLEGTSLKPLMDDPGRPWKPAAFSQYPRGKVMGYTMRTDRYRYTEWQQKDKTVVARELYDHQTDPGENVNIANRPDAAETVAQLGRMLSDGWQAARPPA